MFNRSKHQCRQAVLVEQVGIGMSLVKGILDVNGLSDCFTAYDDRVAVDLSVCPFPFAVFAGDLEPLQCFSMFESQALAAGKQTLRWDGNDTNGNLAPDGKYTFEIMAQDAGKNKVNAITYSKGMVSGISFENNITYLQTGDRRIAVGDVVQVGSGTDAPTQN